MAKPGLGKGLGALLPDPEFLPPEEERAVSDAPAREPEARRAATGGIETVPLDKIKPNPDQPRKAFTEESLDELAESLKNHGVIQPILVEPDGAGGFLIVAGERRYRAALRAGFAEIPVIVRTYSREKRMEIALVENVQREDLNPMEEAEAYRGIMEISGLTQEDVAEKVGKNRSTVANALRLLKLPEEARKAVREGNLSPGHARALLAAVNPADRDILFARIMAQGLSVRQAEALSSELNRGIRSDPAKKHASPSQAKPLDPEIKRIEQRLIDALGTKVSIAGDGKSGSIRIDYYSTEDLERVLAVVESST